MQAVKAQTRDLLGNDERLGRLVDPLKPRRKRYLQNFFCGVLSFRQLFLAKNCMNSKTTLQSQNPTTQTSESLLKELGGQLALDAFVGAFYFNVLHDTRLARFLANTNIDALRKHQRMFLAAALGGEDQYCGRSLFQAHRSLVQERGLDHSHFDAITEILVSTIQQFGHPEKLIQKVIARVNALRADVLGTSLLHK